MFLDKLSREQLVWFNRVAANSARLWARIVDRLEREKCPKADPVYQFCLSLQDTCRGLAKATHDALNRFRDSDYEYSKKRNAGRIMRTRMRDRWEQGY